MHSGQAAAAPRHELPRRHLVPSPREAACMKEADKISAVKTVIAEDDLSD